MDFFVALFSLQFGPHSIVKHPFLENTDLVNRVYLDYSIGLSFGYIGIAIGLLIVGIAGKTRAIRLYPFTGKDISPRGGVYLLGVSLLYILFFIAFQGFDLGRTVSYLNFFRGNSEFSYTELRREIFEDDAGLSLAAVTRQTSSALLFAALVYCGIKFNSWRYIYLGTAILLFVICSMQMNKFPYLYYALVTAVVIFSNNSYTTGKFITKAIAIRAIAIATILVSLLALLYFIQYGSELSSGIVTADRLLFRLVSRPFAGNHDSLYYWFDVFPDIYSHIGFANIPAVAKLLNITPFFPTLEVPALYFNVNTTFQAGYIGGAYASFGYPGIFIYSLFVGGWVAFLTRYESQINYRWQRIVFLAVIGVNMYFLSSRELHTAMQSGGFILAPLIVMLARAMKVNFR